MQGLSFDFRKGTKGAWQRAVGPVQLPCRSSFHLVPSMPTSLGSSRLVNGESTRRYNNGSWFRKTRRLGSGPGTFPGNDSAIPQRTRKGISFRQSQQTMPANHTDLDKRLWGAADELRANSRLKSSDNSVPNPWPSFSCDKTCAPDFPPPLPARQPAGYHRS
jgi:hypothetical protein